MDHDYIKASIPWKTGKQKLLLNPKFIEIRGRVPRELGYKLLILLCFLE
jgi:hypothetical protein